MSKKPAITKPVTTKQVMAFSLPNFVASVMHGQTSSTLPSIYAIYFGLDLALIGTALLIVRMFDTVTDPLIGYLSDHTESRFGRRKPWIVAGSLMGAPSIIFFFIPPDGVSIYYFTGWYAMVYLAWTLIEIPMLSWQAEISLDYKVRTKIASVRLAFQIIGTTCFFLVPLIPFFATTEFTPQVLAWIGWTAAVLLPLTIFVAVMYVPKGEDYVRPERRDTFVKMLKGVIKNKAARLYFLAYILLGIGNGIGFTVVFIYIVSYLQLGDKIPYLMTIPALVSFVFIPVWFRLCNRFGRHRTWSAASFMGSFLMLLVFLIKPGESSFIPYLTLFTVYQIFGTVAWVAYPGIVADIVDYDKLKSGVNRTGQYFSFLALLTKTTIAIGSAMGFYILKLSGFDASAEMHSAEAAMGIKITVSLIPAIFFLMSAVLIWNFPINKKRQNIIQRRLEGRKRLFESSS